jgi:hypothetical protein
MLSGVTRTPSWDLVLKKQTESYTTRAFNTTAGSSAFNTATASSPFNTTAAPSAPLPPLPPKAAVVSPATLPKVPFLFLFFNKSCLFVSWGEYLTSQLIKKNKTVRKRDILPKVPPPVVPLPPVTVHFDTFGIFRALEDGGFSR